MIGCKSVLLKIDDSVNNTPTLSGVKKHETAVVLNIEKNSVSGEDY
jgi:hypothetical protein